MGKEGERLKSHARASAHHAARAVDGESPTPRPHHAARAVDGESLQDSCCVADALTCVCERRAWVRAGPLTQARASGLFYSLQSALTLYILPDADVDSTEPTQTQRTPVPAASVCALAHPCAAERRLMVWPPIAKKGSKCRIACLFDWGRS